MCVHVRHTVSFPQRCHSAWATRGTQVEICTAWHQGKHTHTCVDTRLCTCTCLAGDMVSVVDREHPRSHKVHNAEPNIQDQGREGLAEVRDLKETEESSWDHPSPVQGRLEVQRDESQTNVSCPYTYLLPYMYTYTLPSISTYLHVHIMSACLVHVRNTSISIHLHLHVMSACLAVVCLPLSPDSLQWCGHVLHWQGTCCLVCASVDTVNLLEVFGSFLFTCSWHCERVMKRMPMKQPTLLVAALSEWNTSVCYCSYKYSHMVEVACREVTVQFRGHMYLTVRIS